ncbi:MAG: DNA polymerase II [Ignavibacteriales bacterium]|nr:DNA polymerase II [Ignavibacteriales bacterium]
MNNSKPSFIDAFLFTDEWNDFNNRNSLIFWGTSDEGTVKLIFKNKPVFFVDHSAQNFNLQFSHLRKQTKLKSFSLKPVDAIYFNTQDELLRAEENLLSQNIKTYESDVIPTKRFLMEKGINAQVKIEGKFSKQENALVFHNPKISPTNFTPNLKIASIDIETNVKDNSLYSYAIHLTQNGNEHKIVRVLGDENKQLSDFVFQHEFEKIILENFISDIQKFDPDIIIGWNVLGFDLTILEERAKARNVKFTIGRDNSISKITQRNAGRYFARISGRIVLDGPMTLRSAFYTFEDFKLETVAQELLGTGKTIESDQDKVKQINYLFENDKLKFAEYNLTDCILVSEIFAKVGIIDQLITRSKLSGLFLDQLGQMTAAFDHFYLPKFHKAGFVAPNVKDIYSTQHSAGGYVFDPKPGLYENVFVLDFKSLYPSIIQTFKIDPLSRLLSNENPLQTPVNIKFSRTHHILPNFISELMKHRETAKKNNDKNLSQAIKILMNSFYGVMGSYGCRFYHPNLPDAITGTGQWLLQQSKIFLEKDDVKVIYGDTDSLFVHVTSKFEDADKIGNSIAENLNNYWNKRIKKEFNLESHLEIEYEKYYSKLVLTSMRGREGGAKKRYAGLISKDKIEFVGMEFVRSDWTKLAKNFQYELYFKIFNEEDYENWIRNFVNELLLGKFNSDLIYKKRLRKSSEAYTKTQPPHVKAARMINQKRGTVNYFITKRGPIPTELNPKDFDYQHYIEKQIKPITDSVLMLFGKSFHSIVNAKQLDLF